MILTTMMRAAAGSPFLGDRTAEDRSLFRLSLTLPVGITAGVLGAAVGGGVATALFGALVVGLQGPEAARGLFDVMADPGLLTTSLTAVLGLLLLLAAVNGGAAAAFTAAAAMLAGRPPARYLTSAPRFRWRLLLAGLGLFWLLVGPLLALDGWLDPKVEVMPIVSLAASVPDRLLFAGSAVVLLLLAAAAEELVFRGWLLKVTGAFTLNPWVLMAVNGLAFSAIHFDPNLDAFLVRAVMGAGFVYMTLRLGGLEFAIGAHAANNIFLLLFLQPMSLTPAPPHPFQAEALLTMAVMLAAYVGLSELVARWGPLRRWTGVEA